MVIRDSEMIRVSYRFADNYFTNFSSAGNPTFINISWKILST